MRALVALSMLMLTSSALGVPAQVVAQEGGDEMVAVVVNTLAAQDELDVCFLTRALNQLRAKLFGEEPVGVAAILQKFENRTLSSIGATYHAFATPAS